MSPKLFGNPPKLFDYPYSKVLNKIIKQETNLSFDDDELAYITLHFVVANNKMNKLYKTKE